jgi:hypothetical protein
MSNPAEVLQRVYGNASLERIAVHYGGGESFETLTVAWADEASRAAVVAALTPEVRELMAFIDSLGRRLRAERLKKRWFLHGYNDFESLVDPLIERGLVLLGTLEAREAVSLETALEQGLLKQWIQVTPGFESLAGDPPEARNVVEEIADETVVEVARRLVTVEFNILNAVRFLERQKIRLNRDGAPHRSDLKLLAPSIIDVHPGRAETIPDPNDYLGWDVLVFTLSLAEALGLVERNGEQLRSTTRGTDYFLRPLAERLVLLTRALEQQRVWSEIDAGIWLSSQQPPQTGSGEGAFAEDGGRGNGLAGPRGTIISALKRLGPADWFSVDDTVATIASLESQYLGNALPVGSRDEASIRLFVRTVLTQSLVHVGGIDIGRGSGGEQRARLTPIGRAMIGLGDAVTEGSGQGAILVEPNHEITCFVDNASLKLLWDLSRFAELARTSERVVRYRLTGESAQWGYARGYTAERIAAILREFSAQPVPNAVRVSLNDWERLHRRVTVMLSGDIVAASGRSDPEVIQSGVGFAVEGSDQTEEIDAVHTFVVTGYAEKLDRALTAHRPWIIDYLGPIVPTLSWIDDQTLRAPTGATDLRTLARIQRFCEQEEEQTWRISPERVKKAFGAEGFVRVVEVLREGVVGGLAAEREFALQKLLGRPAEAKIAAMEVVMVASSEEGDRLARVPNIRNFVVDRLGPRAFQVIPGCASKLVDLLRGLGITVTTAK